MASHVDCGVHCGHVFQARGGQTAFDFLLEFDNQSLMIASLLATYDDSIFCRNLAASANLLAFLRRGQGQKKWFPEARVTLPPWFSIH
jgi:hypothetical protein